jgi:hypothetical protein
MFLCQRPTFTLFALQAMGFFTTTSSTDIVRVRLMVLSGSAASEIFNKSRQRRYFRDRSRMDWIRSENSFAQVGQ